MEKTHGLTGFKSEDFASDMAIALFCLLSTNTTRLYYNLPFECANWQDSKRSLAIVRCISQRSDCLAMHSRFVRISGIVWRVVDVDKFAYK